MVSIQDHNRTLDHQGFAYNMAVGHQNSMYDREELATHTSKNSCHIKDLNSSQWQSTFVDRRCQASSLRWYCEAYPRQRGAKPQCSARSNTHLGHTLGQEPIKQVKLDVYIRS